jgi:hypothetical protein
VRVALFNLSDAPMDVDRSRQELGLNNDNPFLRVRDVWTAKIVSVPKNRIRLTIPPHGAALLELVPESMHCSEAECL